MNPASILSAPDHRRTWSWPTNWVVSAIVLGLVAVSAVVLLSVQAGWTTIIPIISSGLVAGSPLRPAYTFVDGAVAKIDADSGAVLAKSPLDGAIKAPSLAVSHDGKAVFVLNTAWDGRQALDRLTVLVADTLTPVANIPTEPYQSHGWPPGLAVLGDDKTVVVYHIDFSSGAPGFWLSYFDRQSLTFAAERTVLSGCGAAQLLPVTQQLAVLCLESNDVRVVEPISRQITRTVPLGRPRAGNTPGWAVSAGVLPDQAALAILKDDGTLVHIDLLQGTVRAVGTIAPGSKQVIPRDGGAAFSTSGRAVVALLDNPAGGLSGAASTLLVVDTVTGQVLDRVTLVAPTQYGIDISPDGKRAFARVGIGSNLRLQTVDLTGHGMQAFGAGSGRMWPHLVFANPG